MTLVGLLVLLIIGAICGAIAEMLVGFSVGGFFASAIVGFLGAWIGTWIAREVNLPSVFTVTVDGHAFEVVWAILGAVVLLLVISLFRGAALRRRYYD